MINKLVKKIARDRQAQRQQEHYRDLMRREAKIGGGVFGPTPQGRRREFFCLDEYTWVWHEEWQQNGQHKILTTRYELRPHGILKSQNGHYSEVSARERQHLRKAIRLYMQQVNQQMYAGMLHV